MKAREQSELFEAAFQAAPDSMALLDQEGVIIVANKAWQEFCADNSGESGGYLGWNYLASISPDDTAETDRIQRGLSDLFAGKRQQLKLEYPCHSPNRKRWFLLHATRFEYSGGNAVLVTHVDITARRLAEEKAHEAATRDPLTGMHNRRSFEEGAERSLKLARRTGESVALLYIDMDGFKGLNDEHGHAAGDRVLIEVGRRLTGCLRETDVAARIGGDEFAVICPNCDDDGVRQISNRIREEVSAPVELDAGAYKPSASIGAAVFSGQADTLVSLMEQADQAMYHDKQADPDTVTH